ncbi:unnamed protein product [Gemmata massiliana]|uniref:Uncharacterized protein n=1 Tax=Gemmata massiliana TaxID=1210884 RepID=A0A6P2D1Q5_9BACT|nr:hypothetical protein [Gemmata massiliana]VTR93320.1 unnamed protein product [Gemmata massiliana]
MRTVWRVLAVLVALGSVGALALSWLGMMFSFSDYADPDHAPADRFVFRLVACAGLLGLVGSILVLWCTRRSASRGWHPGTHK